MQVTMTVNGEEVTREIEGRLLLVHFLRDQLRLTGTHWGCDTSNCGTCVVWLDGEPVKSCTVLAAMAGGHEVRTVEGLEEDGELDPVQEGFMQCHGLQCGFCTPGMMMTARALLDRNPDPTSRRSARRSPARSAAAPATPPSSARCSGPPQHEAARSGGRHRMHAAPSEPQTAVETGRRPGRQRPEAVRPRPDAAQGGPALHPRPRPLRRRRRSCPACCTWRSCARRFAHARIVSIDISAAQAHPKVKAVVTGADLAEKGLAWMPTLSNDVQAVLATDKVRFQGQEVAFVVAEDRYSARDALELIDVEYDVLRPGRSTPARRSTRTRR